MAKRWFTNPRLWLAGAVLLGTACVCLIPAGCGPSGPRKYKVAYLGLTCEAPIFVAQEKGFFKDEGLDVELVKTDWDGLREGLGTGRFDANHTLIMYLLIPMENGLDVKITGGIHTGCLRLMAGAKTDIKTVEDLKGKTIGVPTHIGSPPCLFASRVLSAHHIDPNTDPHKGAVTWKAFQPGELEKALDSGLVDAVAASDPIGTILIGHDKVRVIADQAVDEPYKDEYCCAAVVSGKLAKGDPAAAAKLTRALLRGSKWVGENPKAAAEMSVDKEYLGSSKEINIQAISKLKYIPGVSKCRESVLQAARQMKDAGLLQPTTDPEELTKRAWLDLEGVTDSWVEGLKVDRVPGGGRPLLLSPAAFAALFDGRKSCCGACCCVGE